MIGPYRRTQGWNCSRKVIRNWRGEVNISLVDGEKDEGWRMKDDDDAEGENF